MVNERMLIILLAIIGLISYLLFILQSKSIILTGLIGALLIIAITITVIINYRRINLF